MKNGLAFSPYLFTLDYVINLNKLERFTNDHNVILYDKTVKISSLIYFI
jgi:hypothetical protein